MEPFVRLTAVAAPLDAPNVDTDRIIPARFLREPRGPAYARFLFHDLRFAPDGGLRGDFVLDKPAYRQARILVVADNFGCGSSREMAVWALDAHGIRAVIAPSLGDIFAENCAKNGLVPVVLPGDVVAALRHQLHACPGCRVTVDLEAQSVTGPDGGTHGFAIDPFRKAMLLSGQDEVALTLGHEAALAAFEAQQRREAPWLSA